jgi:endonuclease/exonuclease/phosphatase family metal-dependent hydrolase
MTYNIKGQAAFFHRDHVQKIGSLIRESGADIVGLQEVHRGTFLSRRRDQPAELEEASGMKVYFGPSFGDEKRAYGNAILTRLPLDETHVEGLPGSGEPRSLFAATATIETMKMHVYVTHLAAWFRFGRTTRQMQAEAVARIAGEAKLPFVLMGDFNTSPTSDELRAFHDGNLVTSCFVEPVVTHRATQQCLDYIFVDPAWTIRDARVLREGPSDHWPLIAELERAAR